MASGGLKRRRSEALPDAGLLKALPQSAMTGLVSDFAASGDIDGIKTLISANADANAGTPHDMRTPLHLAAASGNLQMVTFLVEECKATLQRDRFGLLPIHDAVQNGHNEVRRYLQNYQFEDNSKKRTRVEEPFPRPNLEVIGSLEGEALEDLMSTVFELVVKEGVFSYTTVHAEVQHFFRLGFHVVYFQHFTALQIAKHVHCLIAAKHVARATNDVGGIEFDFKSEHSGFFLSTIGWSGRATESQKRTEEKVSELLTQWSGKNVSIIFMSSESEVFAGREEHLGMYNIDRGHFDTTSVSEGETSLEVLASAKFLKTKSNAAKEQYQIAMEDVVATKSSVVRVIPGSVYPGPYPGGFVVMFCTPDTVGRHYLPEICQAMRFVGLIPRRFYFENFANGVLTYSLFFPSAKEEEVQHLKRTIMFSTHLKARPLNSALVYNRVMESKISHECGIYLLAAVRFVYAFFPKEQYSREYTSVHKVLENDPAAQQKLETLYKLCIKDLLSTERIYQLVHRHVELANRFYEDFREIALGKVEPHFNSELGSLIDSACSDPQDRQIMRMFLTFNESILLTNFFKSETPSAFAFRLDPAVVLRNRPTSLYPEVPYAIYFIYGRDFQGFHTRFRDVARGGIRLVMSRTMQAYERNLATLFDECYSLAFTQQNKNKDIPEGGAKGVILPDFSWPDVIGGSSGNVLTGASAQSPIAFKSCFIRYLNSLLDCMLPQAAGIYAGHMKGKEDILFFGPDENTAGFMDLGAQLAQVRGYPYWKALTTGKSVALGGVPHDTYGMTTSSVHTYVTELLRELGEDETKITKFQTGGPDGDLGSNEILISKDKTIGIVDGSGALYDPAGIDRVELTRLAKRRVPVRDFNRSFLSPAGFLVTVDDSDVVLPDGSRWLTGAELRDSFHLTDYASADLFVPCGGRPNAVTTDNVKLLFADGGARPKFRMIVEGANLFLSDGARAVLEKAGVHVFKDASTNKGGVNSSSLEVFAALALPLKDHSELMCYDPRAGGAPPSFYQEYVQQILDIIKDNAKREFQQIWACNQKHGYSKVEATKLISGKITRMQDSIMVTFKDMTQVERDMLVRRALQRAVPPLIIQHLGVDGVLNQVPPSYIAAVVGAWVASRFVYKYGVNTSEVSFFFFLRSLLGNEDQVDKAISYNGGS